MPYPSSTIPPIDPSLPGYSSMAGLSGISDPTVPLSTSLKPLGVNSTKLPTSSVPGIGSNMSPLEAAKKAGGGIKDPESPFTKALGNIATGVGIFADLAGIWQGFQAQKLAKHQFSTQLAFANANLGNTVKDYNNRRGDLLTARGFTQGDSAAATQQAISSSSLDFQRIRG